MKKILGKKKKDEINELPEVDLHLTAQQNIDQIEYKKLQDELLGNEKDLQNDYEMFLEERKAMIPLTKKERERVEEIIRFKILRIFKKNKEWSNGKDDNKGYFKYRQFREIEEIKNYFNIMMAIGDRNIGKSTSAQEEVDLVVKKGKRFMWLRNIDDEVKEQVNSDVGEDGWLTKRGWTFEGSAKSPTIITPNKVTLGWYRPVNTSSKFKSVNFPETELIVYEEFPEGNVKGKYFKFVKFASTTLRMNQGYAIMQANFTDQQDEMLQSLGVGNKKLTAQDFVFFNWVVGAIIIFIPKGIYRQTKDKKKDLAYRASLGDQRVWKSQYGSGFSNEEPNNIINDNNFSSIEPVFNIYTGNAANRADVRAYGAFKMTLYKVYDDEGNFHNVIAETLQPNDKPIFIFESLNKVMYPHAQMLEIDALENLLHHWSTGNLKTTSMAAHQRISVIFANALKVLKQDDEYITDIENIISN